MASASFNIFTPPVEKHIRDVMKTILEDSGLQQEWIDFIKNDPELYTSFYEAVRGLVTYYTGREKQSLIPVKKNTILAALKYCKPAEVKVIILGFDPIALPDLATGLAFSYPDGKTEDDFSSTGPGCSVWRVHAALKNAGINPGDSLNHEHWAENGVLLLDACLTLDPDNNELIENPKKSHKKEKPHFRYWENFTTRLVIKLLREKILQTPIFVLCWGTHAEDVGKALLPDTAQTGGNIQPQPPIRTPLLHAQTGAVLTHSEFLNDTDHKVTDPQSLQDVDYVVYIGNHPTFYDRSFSFFFREQAPNQFKTVEHFYKGLFDQRAPTADVTTDELTQGVKQL